MFKIKSWQASVKAIELLPLRHGAWPALYLLLALSAIASYLPWHTFNFWLALMLLFQYVRYPLPGRGGYRFLYGSLGIALFGCLIPKTSLLYFALLLALLGCVEAQRGRLPGAVLLALFLMSPIPDYVAEIFRAPVQFQLGAWAAKMLSVFSGHTAQALGNTLEYAGRWYEVEEIGLDESFLIRSLLVALLLVVHFQVRNHRRLPALYTPFVLAFFLCTHVAANLALMVCLVYFDISGNSHPGEAMRLLCWVVYGLLPGYGMLRLLVKQAGDYDRVKPFAGWHAPLLRHYHLLQLVLLMVLTVAHRMCINQPRHRALPRVDVLVPQDYDQHVLEKEGIVKWSSSHHEVYLKPLVSFNSSEHNNAIRKRSIGYQLCRLQRLHTPQGTCYSAMLENAEQRLYAAWWYQHGRHTTLHQLVWQYQSLRYGKNYVLLYVIAPSEAELEEAVQKWMQLSPKALR